LGYESRIMISSIDAPGVELMPIPEMHRAPKSGRWQPGEVARRASGDSGGIKFDFLYIRWKADCDENGVYSDYSSVEEVWPAFKILLT